MSKLIASAEAGFFSDWINPQKFDRSAIGLSYSGGGYRATLFHAGAVLRQNELGLLSKAARIVSVSGGSITTGILAQAWSKLEFDADGVASADSMRKHFIEPIFKATSQSIDVGVGVWGLVPFVSAGNKLADSYDRNIFGGLKIRDIPENPKFIFCATNLQTGGLFRFTRDYLADWRGVESTTKHVRLAEAVAASSAFPPVLAPLRLDLGREEMKTPQGARFTDPKLLRRPVLVDGGVYDNLGLEPIWKRCGVLISSYAGQNNAADTGNFNIDMMIPVVFRFLESSIDWRERVLVAFFKNVLGDGLPERCGSYWTAATPLTAFTAPSGWRPPQEVFDTVNAMATRLNSFPPEVRRAAVLAGYSLADAGIRTHVLPDAAAPTGPPNLP